MKLDVKRLYRTLECTPLSIAQTPGARVRLICETCGVPRDLDLSGGKLRRYQTEDFEAIFTKVSFKCRCGSYANAMRITRPTRDNSETLLLVSYKGQHHG